MSKNPEPRCLCEVGPFYLVELWPDRWLVSITATGKVLNQFDSRAAAERWLEKGETHAHHTDAVLHGARRD